MTMLGAIQREINRARGLAANMVRRGVIRLASSAGMLQIEAHTDERYDDVELWQHFGFASRPPVGSEVLLAEPHGAGEGAIAIATKHRDHFIEINVGDAVMYGLKTGSDQGKITVRDNGSILIEQGGSALIWIGKSASEFALLGTSFDSSLRTLLAITTPGLGYAFTTMATAWGALAGYGPFAGSIATACTNAKTACTNAKGAIDAFLAGSYLSTKVKVE